MKRYLAAKKFIKNFKLKRNFTYDDLKLIASKQGYQVYEWSNDSIKDEQYLRNADCLDLSKNSDSFSLQGSDSKIVFARKALIEEEKRIVLLHENIHIFCGHVKTNSYFSVTDEKEATDIHRTIDLILNYGKQVLCAIVIATVILFTSIAHTPLNTDEIYVTPSGTHFHRATCTHVVNNKRAYKIDINDIGKNYIPCSLCNPDK